MRLQHSVVFSHRAGEVSAMVGQVGGEAKAAELESGTDGAADERVLAETAGRLPHAGGTDADRSEIRARHIQYMSRQQSRRWIVSEQLQRSAGIEMPDLIRVDDVPATELVALEQIVDRGGGAA